MIHQRKITISGAGCCLVDLLYNHIDFGGREIRPFLSVKDGDGGLAPGKLVFCEDFEHFCGMPLGKAIDRITGARSPDRINVGGPSIVSLIHAAQMTHGDNREIRYYGMAGKDRNGAYLMNFLAGTPVTIHDFKPIEDHTPFTVVLSDPAYEGGNGERIFIHSMGASERMSADHLDDRFFESDIAVFGGTAIVPQIHDHLTKILRTVKSSGGITIVNTVYDFRNEKERPGRRWLLGETDESYRYIDVLITDKEEALRLSGKSSVEQAIDFFKENQAGTMIITNGSEPVHACSDGSLFRETGWIRMPVSERIVQEIKSFRQGDTTGCGDNFVGGMLASLIHQLGRGVHPPELTDALSWAIVSGGFACSYMGGTFFEASPGVKLNNIKPYLDDYQAQIKYR